jgi:hypothetical protein
MFSTEDLTSLSPAGTCHDSITILALAVDLTDSIRSICFVYEAINT